MIVYQAYMVIFRGFKGKVLDILKETLQPCCKSHFNSFIIIILSSFSNDILSKTICQMKNYVFFLYRGVTPHYKQ